MWLVGVGGIYGCGCKEVHVYRFPHITYPYSSWHLVGKVRYVCVVFLSSPHLRLVHTYLVYVCHVL